MQMKRTRAGVCTNRVPNADEPQSNEERDRYRMRCAGAANRSLTVAAPKPTLEFPATLGKNLTIEVLSSRSDLIEKECMQAAIF